MVKQGQIIWLDLESTRGHEQAGKRPVVVLSNNFSMSKLNMIYICPIINTKKPFPMHIPLDNRTKTTGVILCEYGRAVDLRARILKAEDYIEDCPKDILELAIEAFYSLIRIN
jgi:mRNA interferase MazF